MIIIKISPYVISLNVETHRSGAPTVAEVWGTFWTASGGFGRAPSEVWARRGDVAGNPVQDQS